MCLVNMTCKQSFWPDKLIAILAGHCQLTGCFFLALMSVTSWEFANSYQGAKKPHFYSFPFGQAEASIY